MAIDLKATKVKGTPVCIEMWLWFHMLDDAVQ